MEARGGEIRDAEGADVARLSVAGRRRTEEGRGELDFFTLGELDRLGEADRLGEDDGLGTLDGLGAGERDVDGAEGQSSVGGVGSWQSPCSSALAERGGSPTAVCTIVVRTAPAATSPRDTKVSTCLVGTS